MVEPPAKVVHSEEHYLIQWMHSHREQGAVPCVAFDLGTSKILLLHKIRWIVKGCGFSLRRIITILG